MPFVALTAALPSLRSGHCLAATQRAPIAHARTRKHTRRVENTLSSHKSSFNQLSLFYLLYTHLTKCPNIRSSCSPSQFQISRRVTPRPSTKSSPSSSLSSKHFSSVSTSPISCNRAHILAHSRVCTRTSALSGFVASFRTLQYSTSKALANRRFSSFDIPRHHTAASSRSSSNRLDCSVHSTCPKPARSSEFLNDAISIDISCGKTLSNCRMSTQP